MYHSKCTRSRWFHTDRQVRHWKYRKEMKWNAIQFPKHCASMAFAGATLLQSNLVVGSHILGKEGYIACTWMLLVNVPADDFGTQRFSFKIFSSTSPDATWTSFPPFDVGFKSYHYNTESLAWTWMVSVLLMVAQHDHNRKKRIFLEVHHAKHIAFEVYCMI